MAKKTNDKKWTRQDLVEFLEVFIEREIPIFSNPTLQALLSRDQKLFVNQVTRESNGNIAYRTVDFDIDSLDDEGFWERIDDTDYNDLIEENAAAAILKMAERFNLIN